MKNTEIWLPVKDYEDLYEISSEGRIRSLNYLRTGRAQVLKPTMAGHGYLKVMLCKNGEHKQYLIHRLVAEAFLANVKDLPQVNHKDEDKTNNCVSNLEWCTCEYNNRYGTKNARIAAVKGKPVQQLSKDGTLVALWPSTHEAARQIGVNQQDICKCCNGQPHHYTAGGFVWKYAE